MHTHRRANKHTWTGSVMYLWIKMRDFDRELGLNKGRKPGQKMYRYLGFFSGHQYTGCRDSPNTRRPGNGIRSHDEIQLDFA